MTRALALVATLLALSACKPDDPFPQPIETRRLTLSETVLSAALSGEHSDADAALALAQVTLAGHAPRLRLVVAGDSPVLARGAARALVRIRVAGVADATAVLAECVKTETNDFVRAECERTQTPSAPGDVDKIATLLESRDEADRLDGLRALLSLDAPFARVNARVDSALLHLVQDDAPGVKLLATAAFLRRALTVGR